MGKPSSEREKYPIYPKSECKQCEEEGHNLEGFLASLALATLYIALYSNLNRILSLEEQNLENVNTQSYNSPLEGRTTGLTGLTGLRRPTRKMN